MERSPMQTPLKMTFRNIEAQPEVEAAIRERVQWLERYAPRIIGCRVLVEVPHRRQKEGAHYHVHIDVTVPGDELVVTRAPAEHDAHENVQVAIREAFQAMRRALEERAERMREHGKRPEKRARVPTGV